jgi:hypothetical protein
MSWTCPYCSRIQLLTTGNYKADFRKLYIGQTKYGDVGMSTTAIRCLNTQCNEVTLTARFTLLREITNERYAEGEVISAYQLKPESAARLFPEYISTALRQDYIEARRIACLSPKASAALARRCLQGIIRDFCGIARGTLDAEIRALEAALDEGKAPQGVTPESIEATDHVRKIGNIGAHMEKDINLIIEIDEDEANELIGLIELLFEEWYIARNSRTERLTKIKQIREAKDQQKQDRSDQRDSQSMKIEMREMAGGGRPVTSAANSNREAR